VEVERSQPSDFEPTPSDADWQDLPSDDSPEERRMLISFAAILVAFKLLGLAVIVVFMFRAGLSDAVAFLAATHIPFVLVGLGLLDMPLSALVRRLRLRARRRQLIWAEWNVDETSNTPL
jgi:hypothetical protein